MAEFFVGVVLFLISFGAGFSAGIASSAGDLVRMRKVARGEFFRGRIEGRILLARIYGKLSPAAREEFEQARAVVGDPFSRDY